MLLGDAVQSVDARIAPFQSFVQFGARSKVLVTGWVKFHAHFGDPFLNIKSSPALLASFLSCLLSSVSHLRQNRLLFLVFFFPIISPLNFSSLKVPSVSDVRGFLEMDGLLLDDGEIAEPLSSPFYDTLEIQENSLGDQQQLVVMAKVIQQRLYPRNGRENASTTIEHFYLANACIEHSCINRVTCKLRIYLVIK